MSDPISRQAAIDALIEWYGCEPSDLDYFKEIVEKLPSADRPQGEWKRRIVDNGFNADWVCSECGYRVKTDFVDYNYCPNCGAKMEGADNE